MDFMTREVFDALIVAVILIGGALAAVRLYQDFTRPIANAGSPEWANEDTQPNQATTVQNETDEK